jgi:tetraprenyl-beta-curcumene synthase
MYDYLDGLTEQATTDPLRDGHRLFQAFIDAVTPCSPLTTDHYRCRRKTEDGGYLQELANTVKVALAQLPATAAITDAALASATRCAEAQIRVHAAQQLGVTQLERWATQEAEGTALEWREFLAGAVASVLAVHALIAAAADRHTTPEQATAIATAYLSISAMSTMLDSLIDYEYDTSTNTSWYLEHYDDHSLLEQQITHVARHAATRARALPNAAHHTMTLVGVVAYYTSASAATGKLARPIVTQIHGELQPLIMPTLAVMRTWRIAKRLRRRLRPSTMDQKPR